MLESLVGEQKSIKPGESVKTNCLGRKGERDTCQDEGAEESSMNIPSSSSI